MSLGQTWKGCAWLETLFCLLHRRSRSTGSESPGFPSREQAASGGSAPASLLLTWWDSLTGAKWGGQQLLARKDGAPANRSQPTSSYGPACRSNEQPVAAESSRRLGARSSDARLRRYA